MTEEDKDIRQMFADFNPPLADGFMSQLDGRLDAVEELRAANAAYVSRLRRSARIAALAATVAGAAMAFAAPYVASFLRSLTFMNVTPQAATVASWVATAATALLAAMTARDLSSPSELPEVHR